ncbi:hypothetical protein PENANT_c002G01427 [Penicillium antarcticum]|uniref:Transcription initiation factor TFIID subunit 8 n=1 Tax=Penicillium antarcticum TaxID=416450 RepID=A0A1V6QJZ4_9EURO|nr:uncharacterized protein N7508_008423 [Penicillium antarcticum]KAJ5293602.1 hypothetical protein N7508_008423 [Penicillium antarcticum]OQD89525.1 hypothetical protein PENANT_c002G01427 [Penicillium antarcticum]
MAPPSRRNLHHSNLRSIKLRKPVAMAASGTPVKRSTSVDQHNIKRLKQYHHHHRLHEPVTLPSSEPAVQDEAHVDQLMNRAIGITLKDAGYDLAEPIALSSFRSATEEYMLRLSTFARQSMLSSRRTQPIPQDFEHALTRFRLTPDDLLPTLKSSRSSIPAPPLLSSPETEDVLPPSLPFLTALSSEDDRANRSYIPKHFPSFPSKHTYSATAVFVERDGDQRKIRERAAEDGRHGEEALRKLASAAFRDNQTGSTGHHKKLWGRRTDSMETMFEKTAKALTKKLNKDPHTTSAAAALIDSAMEIDSGNPDADKARAKLLWNMEMGPIVNCERDLWRRTASNTRRGEENDQKPSASAEPPEVMTGV